MNENIFQKNNNHYDNTVLSSLIILLVLFFVILVSPIVGANEYVGSKQCATCHEKAYQAWQGSHHDMAMKHANEESVLGNFDNYTFTGSESIITVDTASHVDKSRFFKKGKQYWVHIKGDNGKHQNYQIKYTFGFTPLQQYMVEFADGRVQLIPFAWDSRLKSDGGQRWFNLYPDMTEKHQEFFWTNTGQNWNYMCADCHSTNVSKNFDLKTNSYKTTFSEINVACESCHGPASDHIKWTQSFNNGKDKSKQKEHYGFKRTISPSVNQWILDKTNPNRKTLTANKIEHSQQVVVCAQCHSRRTQISTNDHVKGNAFGERYLLDLVSSTNYHPDGQVYNEDFVYGSFLQSKMYQSGVVCSDCHDPHTAELKLPVETLCLQCHQADNYATSKHHKHQVKSDGAMCVNCHMPETTYMSVDARRDHGFHIPRPDLANQLGTPDTCLSCHQDKDSQWSDKAVNAWYPKSTVKEEKDFAPIFSAITMSLNEQQLQGVSNELSRIAQTISYAPIIRASALAKMATVSNTNTIIAIARAVKNPDVNIRLGAIEGAQSMRGAEKWRVISPLLSDKVFAVRTNAAFALASLWPNLATAQKQQLTPALNEYLASQDYNSDRSFAHSNKGIIYAYQGEYLQAIDAFSQGIIIEPYFVQTHLNLSQVYYQRGDHTKSINVLTKAKSANPTSAQVPYNLGLAYIRAKDKVSAAKELELATTLEPNNSHYFYVYGLSLEQHKPTKAYGALYQAYQLSNNPQHLYALCEMQVRHKNPLAAQCLMQLEPLVPKNVIQGLKLQLKNN